MSAQGFNSKRVRYLIDAVRDNELAYRKYKEILKGRSFRLIEYAVDNAVYTGIYRVK